ncbi:MAG: hypothetical protein HY879_05505 [Deltaproteobacteria bacterium]|nr:hypothetical protein [Deltaproteobacteria bacterium]
MTLVVSEISRHGVVMIGDSAITYSDAYGSPVDAIEGAAKVQYSEKANIGFAIWGNGIIQGQQIDAWLKDFIDSSIVENEELESVGQRLTARLRIELEKENRPWYQLVFGIHLAGYKEDLPRLWHIHCGHHNETPHEPRLYHDYPEDQKWPEDYYRALFFPPGSEATAKVHLRNGYTPHYALLFKSIDEYVNNLRENLGIDLPRNSLEGQLHFHKLLVRFVAGALVAAGEHPGVNDKLSSISFNRSGLISDDRFPTIDWLNTAPSSLKSITRIWL